MATMKDLANHTGLGLATISKYLNGGHVLDRNREAIEAAVSELGFTVNEFARSLKTSRSRTVGVVIPELSNLFVTSIVTVIEDVLRRSGYGVIVCDCRTDETQEADAVRFLMGKMVDGIICMPVSNSGAQFDAALEKGVPVVLLDRMNGALRGKVSAVLVDNVSASAQAVRLLLEAGHTGIGVILGPREVFTSQQRLLGYHQELLKNGLIPAPELAEYSDYTVQGGYESMKRLLTLPELTAVFVTNYEMTLGAIIAVNELGVRIPEQLSFIGFDNLQLAQVIKPKLTIVTQPLEEIGREAARILLESLSGNEEPQMVTLSPGMQAGESVRTVKAQ